MSTEVVTPAVWSRWGYWSVFAFVFAAQIALILRFSDRSPVVPRKVDASPVIQILSSRPENAAFAEWVALFDPTLFATETPHGFTGRSRRQSQSFVHEPFIWKEPRHWLTQDWSRLGASRSRLSQSNGRVGDGFYVRRLRPTVTPVRAAPVPFPDASGFRIEGDIASRSLLAAPSIPSIAHTNLLPATTVELSVWPSGFPFSAIVTGGCGFKLADQRALDLALGMRFERLPHADPDSGRETEPLTWGRIVFQWHIIAPNQTNAPPPGVAP